MKTLTTNTSTTLWSSMEQHAIYNCDSPDTDLEFTPMQEDKYLMESITPIHERRFDLTQGEFWTPETQDITTEYIKNDILHKLDIDTPKTRRLERFEMFVNLTNTAKSLAALGYVGHLAYKAIEDSIQTFEIEGKVHKAPTIFPSGHLKLFWKAYKHRKDQLAKVSLSQVQQIEELLASELTVQELKALKKEIYTTNISYSQKQDYWAQCDKLIAA